VFRSPRWHRDGIYAPPLVISSSCRLNSCGLRAFSVLGPREWNSLPRLLCDTSHNTTSFKHSLKTFSSLSMLGTSTIMRYTNLRFTYLLTCRTASCQSRCGLTTCRNWLSRPLLLSSATSLILQNRDKFFKQVSSLEPVVPSNRTLHHASLCFNLEQSN